MFLLVYQLNISFVHDLYLLQSNQVKCTPQGDINELIIWILNPLIPSRMQ